MYKITHLIDNQRIETTIPGDFITYHVATNLALSFVSINSKTEGIVAIIPAQHLLFVIKVSDK